MIQAGASYRALCQRKLSRALSYLQRHFRVKFKLRNEFRPMLELLCLIVDVIIEHGVMTWELDRFEFSRPPFAKLDPMIHQLQTILFIFKPGLRTHSILIEFTENCQAEYKFFIFDFANSRSIILPSLLQVHVVFVGSRAGQSSSNFCQV